MFLILHEMVLRDIPFVAVSQPLQAAGERFPLVTIFTLLQTSFETAKDKRVHT